MTLAAPILDLDDAKSYLRISADDLDEDIRVQGFIDSASQMWVDRVGPVVATTYDEFYDGGAPKIVLDNTPLLAVQTVTEARAASLVYTLTEQPLDGTDPGDYYGYTIDLDYGLLVRRALGSPIPFAPGIRNVHVAYTAGYTSTPEDIKDAVRALVARKWETQRGPAQRPGNTQDAPGGVWPPLAEQIAQHYANVAVG